MVKDGESEAGNSVLQDYGTTERQNGRRNVQHSLAHFSISNVHQDLNRPEISLDPAGQEVTANHHTRRYPSAS